jgi:hypothetical protein
MKKPILMKKGVKKSKQAGEPKIGAATRFRVKNF